MRFLECVDLNPKIVMIKGQIYPFVEMANVSTCYRSPDNVDAKPFDSGVKFQDGDTVIARITPCLQNGKRFYCQNIGTGFGSTEYLVFRPKDDSVDSKYLYYFMMTDFVKLSMINSMTGATGRQRVNNDVFNDIEVCFPDIDIQRKIGEILSAYDNLIENNQKQIKLLEEAAQRLYKEWFVDLRFPGYEDTPIVDGVPEGWERLPVGELIEKIPRTTQIMASEYGKEGPIPIIDQSREFIAGYTDNHASLVNVGKSVIVFGDHTRILKYIQFPFAKGADGTQLIVSNTDRMPQSLFYCSLVGVDLSNYHYARHLKYLKAEELLVPTQVIAEAFDRFVSPMFSKIQRLRDINKAATNARDRLLPKLMSGEIEV